MTEAEQWDSYFKYAGALKIAGGTAPLASGIRGRFISVLIRRLAEFWERNRDTLIPFLSQIAIAAIEALIAHRQSFENLNTPGPV